ncbi:MAG: Serine/threonine-protein kinase PrkC [Planctomycetota bacterium]
MSDVTLADYTDQEAVRSCEHWCVLSARRTADGVGEFLTVFSAALSCNPEFRRALKTDLGMLLRLQHPGLLRVYGLMESDGVVVLRTECNDALSLREQMLSERLFSADEVIDIGWQLCSALQRAHNSGLSHGQISADTVLVSDSLQATLLEFGYARWLRAAERRGVAVGEGGGGVLPLAGLISREQVEGDLRDLARLLRELLQRTDASLESDVGVFVGLERLLGRFLDESGGQLPATAREFQGRLGELLIGPGSGVMPVVDERPPAFSSGRSIVKGLFDSGSAVLSGDAAVGRPAGSASRLQKLPFWVVVCVLVILFVVAAVLW